MMMIVYLQICMGAMIGDWKVLWKEATGIRPKRFSLKDQIGS